MATRLARLRGPTLIIPASNSKHLDAASRLAPPSGALTPDLQPSSPTTSDGSSELEERLSQVQHYVIGSQVSESQSAFWACDLRTREDLKCKIFPLKSYRQDVAPYYRLDGHPGVIPIREILLGEKNAYVFFERDYGDLHSYVRDMKKLSEEEAKRLFHQVAEVVQHCHECGVVINQLKLRKFVFKDKSRTRLMLDCSLEDSRVLTPSNPGDSPSTADDTIREKHGCPAYVSPEILDVIGGGPNGYSGRAADVWSMGVVLYTLLLGRYPFQDLEPTRLFLKIRQGRCAVPASLSPLARCLIKTMLRPEAEQRLTSTEILRHPWFRAPTSTDSVAVMSNSSLSSSGMYTVVPVAGSTSSQRVRGSVGGGVRDSSYQCFDQQVPDDDKCDSVGSCKALKRKSNGPPGPHFALYSVNGW